MNSKGVRTMGSPAYDRGHTRRFGLKLNTTYDADIIAKLESVKSIQGYIKALVRADIGEQTPGDNPKGMTIEEARAAEEEYNLVLKMFREAGGVNNDG